MNSAIMAVTKSAYATFHEPPRCFSGALIACATGAMSGCSVFSVFRGESTGLDLPYRGQLHLAAERGGHGHERRAQLRRNRAPRKLGRQQRARPARESV